MSRKVTAASDWRKPREEGYIMELPSGKVVRIRPINMATLLKLGKVPQGLVAVAIKVIMGEDTELPAPQSLEDVQTYLKYYDAICESCLVYPKVVAQPTKDDEITLEDISSQDKVWLAGWLNRPAAELQSFCEKQASNVDSVDSKSTLTPAPEPAVQDT